MRVGADREDRVDLQASFSAIGLSADQQAAAWTQAKARRDGMAGMPAAAQSRMQAGTCTDVFRARFEHDMTN